MADDILDMLGPVLTRWTMGGSAASVAPDAWRDLLGQDPAEAELRLLALSGQYLGTLAIAEPVGGVQPRGDIPQLAQPPLADPLRPRARRLLQQLRDPMRRHLLDFLDARGRTLHPGDWLPRPGDEVPAVYAPWQDWASDATTAADELDAASWDRLGPAARRAAFTTLRQRDPAAATALLAQKLGQETADHRVRLIETLATGLSDADRPLLESLATDRAPRVKALAASLLARMGHGATGGEDAAELAAFHSVQTKGLLRRTRIVVPQPIKTPAQSTRRSNLFDLVAFDAFADALALTADGLATAWAWRDDHRNDYGFASMIARSAPDPIVVAVADALTTPDDIHLLTALLPRLDQRQRHAIATRWLRTTATSFMTALSIAGGCGAIDDPMTTPAGTALLAAIDGGDPAADLLALGLLASRDGAVRALDRLGRAGLIASDPRLDMLRLNAALDDRRLPR
ncbi:DUF5691 domain-containing protein [Sphingomonas sp. Leaf25]|uniref:DUF5691 domain-containing protein n=1 Tax=Sphingomonas sp. Leaf25 TaxID=1735692 RepID=UPI0006F20D3C|nr:DUF5691 domain-containing protein [Sphingomonas sp. Leaf25]KQN06957.1 hypothetical protein ASE78_15170 [Sphingomonas sp. Leaf25]